MRKKKDMARLPRGFYSKDGINIKVRNWYYCMVYIKYIIYRLRCLRIS